MTIEMLIAVMVFLGVGVALWVVWNQAINEGTIKKVALQVAEVEKKVELAHIANNSRMDQLLEITMAAYEAIGYKRAKDEQAIKEAAVKEAKE